MHSTSLHRTTWWSDGKLMKKEVVLRTWSPTIYSLGPVFQNTADTLSLIQGWPGSALCLLQSMVGTLNWMSSPTDEDKKHVSVPACFTRAGKSARGPWKLKKGSFPSCCGKMTRHSPYPHNRWTFATAIRWVPQHLPTVHFFYCLKVQTPHSIQWLTNQSQPINWNQQSASAELPRLCTTWLVK